MKKKLYNIVWNETKTEGFITDDADDAQFAIDGFRASFAVSSVAEAFREAYAYDDEEIELPLQVIELDVEP